MRNLEVQPLQLRDHSERSHRRDLILWKTVLNAPGEHRQRPAGMGADESEIAVARERPVHQQAGDGAGHIEVELGRGNRRCPPPDCGQRRFRAGPSPDERCPALRLLSSSKISARATGSPR